MAVIDIVSQWPKAYTSVNIVKRLLTGLNWMKWHVLRMGLGVVVVKGRVIGLDVESEFEHDDDSSESDSSEMIANIEDLTVSTMNDPNVPNDSSFHHRN